MNSLMKQISTTTLSSLSVRSLIFISLLFFSNCAEAQKKNKKGKEDVNAYEISGKLMGLIQQEDVILAELYQGQIKPLDTIQINMQDSTFIFNGSTTESLMAYLIFSQRTVIPFVLEPGSKQNFEVSLSNQGIQFEVKGFKTENSFKIRQYLENNSKTEYNMQSIENMFRSGQVNPAQASQYENEYLKSQSESKELQFKMLADTSNPIAAYFVMTAFVQDPNKEHFDNILSTFAKSAPNSKYLPEIKARYESVRATMIGEHAPDIKLLNPEGDSVALSSFRGKVVLIDFWASWCGPCRKENPNNKRIYDRFKSKGFEIYAVSLDRARNDWVKTIESDGLPWIHVSDLGYWNSAPAKQYMVKSIPATFLIDREGKIIAKDLRGQELEMFLENYFK